MRVFCYFKSTSDQFGLNRGQFRGRDDDIGIHCEHRLDVAINREPTDDTPETVLIENIDQRRKVANAAVAYRFEDLSCGHLTPDSRVAQAVIVRTKQPKAWTLNIGQHSSEFNL